MEQRQYEAMLADAEIRLKRLRSLYDQWFHGLERLEPQKQKADIERLINELKRDQPRNTALRFRMNQLVQRYMTYTTYWQRITRQIEEGTYKRDVLRARRRMGATRPANEAQGNGVEGYELDIDVEAAPEPELNEAPAAAGEPSAEADRPSRPPRAITPFALPTPVPPKLPAGIGGAAPARLPPPPPLGVAGAVRSGPVPPPPAPAPAGAARKPPPAAVRPAASAASNGNGFSDEQILSLYQRYVSARRDNQERTDNVRLETVAKTVREMMPKLKEKHGGKQIDFEVVVKDGRVALKPIAR